MYRFHFAMSLICAFLWSFMAVDKYMEGMRGMDVGIYILCAVIWTAAAVMSCVRLVRNSKNSSENNEVTKEPWEGGQQ